MIPQPNQATSTVYGNDSLVKMMSGGDWESAGVALSVSDKDVRDAVGMAFKRKQPAAQGLPEETRMQQVQRVMQDKYNRVKIIQDLIAEDGGIVGEQQDVYRAEERMHGRVHEVLRQFADDVVHPLIQKAVDFKIDLNELATYAYAKHAAERNAHIQQTNKSVQTGSGMSDADAKTIIQLVELSQDKAKFEELHNDLMAITATTRQVMLDDGLITQEHYDALIAQYPSGNYVPLRGFEDVDPDSGSVRPGLGRGFNTKGKETIAAMGRDSKAGDIIENIIRDYERVTIRAERNAVGKTFLDLVTLNPDPKLWEVQPVTRATRKVNGLIEYVDVADKGDETISVKVAGEQVYIKINDPLLLRATSAQVSQPPSLFDKARTGNGSGFVLCVPKQSPQNTVHLYSIYADHCKTQALQPTPPRTHAAVPNGSRALRDLARVGQRGSVRRPGRPPHPQALCVQGVCQVSGMRHLCSRLCARTLR